MPVVSEVDIKRELDIILEEHKHLKAFYDAQLELQPFKPNDRIALTDQVLTIDYNVAYGWSSNRKILRPSNTGMIKKVEWNSFSKTWQAAIIFDIEWHLYEFSKSDLPIVFIRHPDSRHLFYMPFRFLEKTEVYKPIPFPSTAHKWQITDIPPEKNNGSYSPKDVTYNEALEYVR